LILNVLYNIKSAIMQV